MADTKWTTKEGMAYQVDGDGIPIAIVKDEKDAQGICNNHNNAALHKRLHDECTLLINQIEFFNDYQDSIERIKKTVALLDGKEEIACLWCSDMFIPKHNGQTCCNDDCLSAHRNKYL